MKAIQRVYDRRASKYDWIVKILSLGRDAAYRKEAIERLELKEGDRVLDIGCGTGLNFAYIEEKVEDGGSIFGLDLSLAMLKQAKKRNCRNVTLIQGETSRMRFPAEYFDGVISTYLLTTVPGYKEALRTMCLSLKRGRKIVLADDRLPSGWFIGPAFMLKNLFRQGWLNYRKGIIEELKALTRDMKITNHLLGLIFIISATKK